MQRTICSRLVQAHGPSINMKKLILWLSLICLPVGAQILSQIFFQNGTAVIGYCSVPGYPSAPESSDSIQLWYKADQIPSCNGSSISTWADNSGNGYTMTFTAGTHT